MTVYAAADPPPPVGTGAPYTFAAVSPAAYSATNGCPRPTTP
ncbi:MAG: hypothetical protein R3F59_00205 [Myxococcota bacterium]